MRDGSRYAVPVEQFILEEVKHSMDTMNKLRRELEIEGAWPLTEERARAWAEDMYSERRLFNKVEIEEVFSPSIYEWSEFSDSAIRLLDEVNERPLPCDMWDDSVEITFLPNAYMLAPADFARNLS